MSRGEVRRRSRARWIAEGRCRDCGAPLDKPGESNKCARCRRSRQGGHQQRRREARAEASGAVTVTMTLPPRIAERIEADAKERGETVAGWCRAEILDVFAEEDGTEAADDGAGAPLPAAELAFDVRMALLKAPAARGMDEVGLRALAGEIAEHLLQANLRIHRGPPARPHSTASRPEGPHGTLPAPGAPFADGEDEHMAREPDR